MILAILAEAALRTFMLGGLAAAKPGDHDFQTTAFGGRNSFLFTITAQKSPLKSDSDHGFG